MSRRPEPPGGWRNHAQHGPMIPAAAIAPLIASLVESDGPGAVAKRAGIPTRRVYSIVTGRQAWVGFDVADRLITRVLGDPSLWRTTPELAEALRACEEIAA